MKVLEQKNDLYLLIGFVLLAAIWAVSHNINRPDYSHVKNITPAKAFQLVDLGNTLLLDVRETKAFEKEHLANAISVPMGSLDKRLNEFANAKAEKIVVYCNDGSTRGPLAPIN